MGQNVVDVDAEPLQRHRSGSAGAEPAVDADGRVGPSGPAEGGGRLDRDAGDPGRQHVALVVLGLALESVPRRHGDHPGGDAVGLEAGSGVEAHRHLAASADEHHLRAVDVVDDGGAHLHGEPVGHDGNACRMRTRAVGPSVSMAAPRLGRLVGVGRADQLSWGMARREARCSIGWWVGPSSPRPTESWVRTKMTFSVLRAARRMAGRS